MNRPATTPWNKSEIVKLRKETFGVTQSVFAAMLGVKTPTVRAWEQGQKVPSGAASRLLEIAAREPEVLKRAAREAAVRGLPGADLVAEGLADLERGQETAAALLVSIGAPRLRLAGLEVRAPLEDPEHRLYRRLSSEEPDSAHSRYNALVRRLASFERALSCAS